MTRIVVVTGLSGSGKTLAAKALEDSGYYYYQYEPGEPEPMGVARAVVAKLTRRRAG